jgi:hypothetical protein
MGILIRHLYFFGCFHLEKVSLNGVYHSKPMAKAAKSQRELSDVDCKQWRLMTDAKHGLFCRVFRGTVFC